MSEGWGAGLGVAVPGGGDVRLQHGEEQAARSEGAAMTARLQL